MERARMAEWHFTNCKKCAIIAIHSKTHIKAKKRFQWAITFSVLTVFSLITLGTLRGQSAHSAYAATIAGSAGLRRLDHVLLTDGHKTSESIAPSILEQLVKNVDRKEELCGLTDSQFDIVQNQSKVKIEYVSVNDHTVAVASTDGRRLTTDELQRILTRARAGRASCVPFDEDQPMILPIIGSHLS